MFSFVKAFLHLWLIKEQSLSNRKPIIFIIFVLFLQTVKSNILLSQNAGNAILDTLEFQDIPWSMPQFP